MNGGDFIDGYYFTPAIEAGVADYVWTMEKVAGRFEIRAAQGAA